MLSPLSSLSLPHRQSLRASSIALLLLTCVVHAQPSPHVTVGGTTVVGRTQTFPGGLGVDFFGGIPFAEPPLGGLRFAPPVLKDTLDGRTLNATEFGAPCVQFDLPGVSEDCLTLNVFRPASIPSNAALPVMVWIYGGGFLQGFTSLYNASAIVAQSVLRSTPVVFVSINYRLGPFGFPQGGEAEQHGALNLGLKDQLAGLQWVQRHVAAFGGDPTKVTVFGQSAGSISIAELFLNSGLERLVRGAIFESGSAASLPIFTASRRQPVWDTFVSNVPACASATRGNTISCMQNSGVDTATLLAAWEQTAASVPLPYLFAPVLDGPNGLIPDLPSRLLAAGNFSKIPFMAGTVLDEGTSFVPDTISSEQQIVSFLTLVDQPFTINPPLAFQQDVARLLQLYPDNPALGSPFGTGNETFGLSSQYKRAAALVGDVCFEATRREWIRAASRAGVQVYGYLFTDHNAVEIPSRGVTHALEIPYAFGLAATNSTSAAVRLLSQAMVDYWISFTVSLTPNDGRGLPKTSWPQYQSNRQVVLLQFDTANFTTNPTFASFPVIADNYRAEQIAFINSIAADLGE
ncbi:extracellular triacylglycerol lipase precursor [Earliella scabrosa]|nr:extracellular triacylglycerol lipase precursor [Earliella scabrosa]